LGSSRRLNWRGLCGSRGPSTPLQLIKSTCPSPPPLVPHPQPRDMAPQVSVPTPHITVYVLTMIHRVFNPLFMHSWPSCQCPSRFFPPPQNPVPSVWCFSACHLHLTIPEVALQSVRSALCPLGILYPLVCVEIQSLSSGSTQMAQAKAIYTKGGPCMLSYSIELTK